MSVDKKPELKLINMADVEATEVKWLWYPYIPYGKITIIQGDPGEGKTTLILNLAAMLSKGDRQELTDLLLSTVRNKKYKVVSFLSGKGDLYTITENLLVRNLGCA